MHEDLVYKELVLDLSHAYGYGQVSSEQLLETCLKQAGIYNKNLLYRVVCGDKIADLKQYGTDHPEISDTVIALSHDEVYISPPEKTLFDDAQEGSETVVIAVYDRDMFHDPLPNGAGNIYGFRNPKQRLDALVAIIEVKW